MGRWVIGILCAMLFSLSGWAWSATTEQVLELQRESRTSLERTAIIETENRILKERLTEVRVQLQEIDRKVTILLQSRRGGND